MEASYNCGPDPAICDPFTGAVLKNAHHTNCNAQAKHNFSKTTCAQLFGEMLQGKCSRPSPCPLCDRTVTEYKPNCELQNLVDTWLNNNDLQQKMPDLIDGPEVSQPANPDAYPLNPSEFVWDSKRSFNSEEEGFFKSEEKEYQSSFYNPGESSSVKQFVFEQSGLMFSVRLYFYCVKDKLLLKQKILNKNLSEIDLLNTRQLLLDISTFNYMVFVDIINYIIGHNKFDRIAQLRLTEALKWIDRKGQLLDCGIPAVDGKNPQKEDSRQKMLDLIEGMEINQSSNPDAYPLTSSNFALVEERCQNSNKECFYSYKNKIKSNCIKRFSIEKWNKIFTIRLLFYNDEDKLLFKRKILNDDQSSVFDAEKILNISCSSYEVFLDKFNYVIEHNGFDRIVNLA